MRFKLIFITIVIVFLWVSAAFSQGFFRTAVHHYIHAGNYYTFSHISRSVADGNSVLITIHTGDRNAHFISSVSAGGQTEVYFKDGVTVNTNGTELECYNHRLSSSRQSVTQVYNGSVINTSNATIVQELITGGASAPTRVGGVSKTREEYVLDKNSTYLVNATNISGAAIDIEISGSFYEMNLR